MGRQAFHFPPYCHRQPFGLITGRCLNATSCPSVQPKPVTPAVNLHPSCACPPPTFSTWIPLSDLKPSPVDEELELKSALKKDCVEHCRNCHRLESHYLAWRAYWYYGILLGFTAGLIQLGPYRCRCCGHYLWIRWDLLKPKFYYQWLTGTLNEKEPQ